MTGVSVIVPVNHPGAWLAALYREYAPVLVAAGFEAEFLFVACPPYESLLASLDGAGTEQARIRRLDVAHPAGAAMLSRVGALEARHDLLLLLPPEPRIAADGLASLVARVRDGSDVAVGSRDPKAVAGLRRMQRDLFHFLARPVTRGRFHDLGAGVIALRRAALVEANIYGDFLLFLPLLLEREGFSVVEIPVAPHPSDARAKFHGPGLWLRSAVDLLGMYFLTRFTERPLRFFGLIGLVLAALGSLVLAVLLAQRLGGVGIANRPALLAGTVLLVLGVQSIALGLVAEIIVHLSAPGRRPYRVARDRAER